MRQVVTEPKHGSNLRRPRSEVRVVPEILIGKCLFLDRIRLEETKTWIMYQRNESTKERSMKSSRRSGRL